MKRNNKALYENIMTSIAKEVKKILNENIQHYRTIVNTKKELLSIIRDTIKKEGNDCDLNWIDVSNITDMSYLFNDPYTNKFNGDISNWNVSNVTDMSYMFYGSDFNRDISNWDVSNVTDMSYMFANSRFDGDISNWNVSNVTDMSYMFAGSYFHQDISKWHVTKYFANGIHSIDMDDPEAVNISYMFYECPIENEYKPYVYPKPRR